jgi:6-pyruvoyl-tetrahydropterin synthase
MNQKKVKKLRKYLIENMDQALILVRNEYGEKTTDMEARQFYQVCKKLYNKGKLNC